MAAAGSLNAAGDEHDKGMQQSVFSRNAMPLADHDADQANIGCLGDQDFCG
jgi:hypothetical protein